MSQSIFVSYNFQAEAEEATALRLQTISNLYGMQVALPFRLAQRTRIHEETQLRIKQADLVVAFCMQDLTDLLKQELSYAIEQKKPIVVIYDQSKGKKINFQNQALAKEVFVDFRETDKALHEIADFIRKQLPLPNQNQLSGTPSQNENGIAIALLGIGLGLLAAWALSKDE